MNADMSRLGVLIAAVAALTVAATALVFAALIPKAMPYSASVSFRVGALWFASGGFTMVIAAVFITRMKLRTRRASRAVKRVTSEAPAPVRA